MKEIPIFNYYAFGYDNYLLINEMRRRKLTGQSSVVSIIEIYLDKIKEMDLSVTYEVSRGLKEIVDDINEMLRDNKTKADELVSDEIAVKIMEIAKNAQFTLMGELKLRKSYSLTPKRYKLESLLSNPGEIFAAHIFKSICTFAQEDFRNGCKSLAFSQSTAAAFHFLRGTEMVLRNYYHHHVKRNRLELPMWGNMLKALEEKKKNKPKKEVLDNLRNIKDNYRNPTQHPDLNYDVDSAQDLLSLTIDVVNKMVLEINHSDVQFSRLFE